MYAKLKQNKTLPDFEIKAIWNPWGPISQTISVTIQLFLRKLYWWECKCYCGFYKILSFPIIKTTNLKFIYCLLYAQRWIYVKLHGLCVDPALIYVNCVKCSILELMLVFATNFTPTLFIIQPLVLEKIGTK